MAHIRGMAQGIAAAPPRVLLFFIAIGLKLLASMLSWTTLINIPVLQSLLPTFLWSIWFPLVFAIAMPETDRFLETRLPVFRRAATGVSLAVVTVAVAVTLLLFTPVTVAKAAGLPTELERWSNSAGLPEGYGDAYALVHQAVNNLIRGENPYRTANVIKALDHAPEAWDKTTPLRTGDFADISIFPSLDHLRQVWDRAEATPSPPPVEFESKVTYPAGAFLLPAPFFLAGVTDLRVVYLILALVAIVATIILLHRESGLVFALAILASVELWFAIARGEVGTLYFALVLPAWVLRRRHPWWSAVLVGLAVTTKQTAWFLAAFFLVEVLRTFGARGLVKTGAVVAGLFLAANLPFFVQDPALWASSVFAPMIDPMFPDGSGPIALLLYAGVDTRSPLVFAILEGVALLAGLLWYFKNCRRYPSTGPLLAIVPLFFAWRSVSYYFFYMDILVLAGMLVSDYVDHRQSSGASVTADR